MRRIALLIETSREFGRGLLRGIARYSQQHGRWVTYCRPHGLGELTYTWLRDWRGDGVIARVANQRMGAAIARLNLPTVNLRGKLAGLPFPYVGVDDVAVARPALEHLLRQGFRHFGFCGYRRRYSAAGDRRCDTFVELARDAGCTAGVCAVSNAEPTAGCEMRAWKRDIDIVSRWLRSLPRPVAVMACTDDRGLLVLEACRRIGAVVPDEVAVIGVANDECLCGLSLPPLSSVDLGAETVGYRAAALLDRLIDGGEAPTRLLVEPRDIVSRRSTDVLAVEDPVAAAALRFIRDHACEQLRVDDVARHVRLSRSSLKNRLKQVLGCTIHQEIQRTRIANAQRLLANSSMPIKQVAQLAGFSSVQYLTRAFRAAMQQTPSVYRRSLQA